MSFELLGTWQALSPGEGGDREMAVDRGLKGREEVEAAVRVSRCQQGGCEGEKQLGSRLQ